MSSQNTNLLHPPSPPSLASQAAPALKYVENKSALGDEGEETASGRERYFLFSTVLMFLCPVSPPACTNTFKVDVLIQNRITASTYISIIRLENMVIIFIYGNKRT